MLPQTTWGTPDWRQSFLVLQPGVSGSPQNGNSASNPGMGGVSANGSMPFSTAMLDGANISSPMSNNVINTPIFDIIGEVKMSDSSFSAQYGTGGIIYNQISKGGTNTIHGLVYDYLRNSGLNAASYGFGLGRIPPLHYNDYGFQVGGPIIKNKIFALFDYDHTINHAASGNFQRFISVPTPAMLTGDFTGLNTIYDPTTQIVNPVTGVATRQTFAAEYGQGNKIPAALIDPVAKNIQAFYNQAYGYSGGKLVAGALTNNFQYISPSQPRLTKWFGRLDADLSQSNRLSGSSAYNYTISPGFGPFAPLNFQNSDVENMSGQLSDVRPFNAHTINEARGGWMGEYDLLVQRRWVRVGQPKSACSSSPTLITFRPSTFRAIRAWVPDSTPTTKRTSSTCQMCLPLIHGRHDTPFRRRVYCLPRGLQLPGATSRLCWAWATPGVYTALSTDPNVLKANPSTGLSYADFLLGYAQNWSALYSPEYGGRLK